jgi:hypothetical protein
MTTTAIDQRVQDDLQAKADFYAAKFDIEPGQMKAALHDIFSMLALANVGPYVDPTRETLTDLRDRCDQAATRLRELNVQNGGDDGRLAAKRDGVKLALSYIDETIRGLDQ